MEFKLLTTEDQEWDILIEKLEKKDIYFKSGYLKTWEKTIGKSEMFFYGDDNNFVVYAYFKRKIKDLDFAKSLDKEYFDIVSPEYYSGPICFVSDQSIKKELYKKFFDAFSKYCKNNSIVCEFARLHPFIKNYEDFSDIVNVEQGYKLVYIDLEKDSETIFSDFKRSNRKHINKAEREGVTIRKSSDKEDVKKFWEIYSKTMDRRSAKDAYMHTLDFFNELLDNLKNNSALYIAEYKGDIIAGSIFLFDNTFFNYFRAGMLKEHPNLGASNLILFNAIKEAKEKGCKIFILGGGNQPNDNLFIFKKSFSKDTTFFHYYKLIHDKKIYDMLNELYTKKGRSIKEGYFPSYRD